MMKKALQSAEQLLSAALKKSDDVGGAQKTVPENVMNNLPVARCEGYCVNT